VGVTRPVLAVRIDSGTAVQSALGGFAPFERFFDMFRQRCTTRVILFCLIPGRPTPDGNAVQSVVVVSYALGARVTTKHAVEVIRWIPGPTRDASIRPTNSTRVRRCRP
jgi:hypothetical protein